MKTAAFLLLIPFLIAPPKKRPDSKPMAAAVRAFLQSLTPEQRQKAFFAFTDEERFDWHFVPRERKGLPLKAMTEPQRQAAMAILKTALSDQGYAKATSIIDLENVLRVVENRPPNDTRRDPENYSFSVFGEPGVATPGGTEPWGWRVDGHHLCLHFTSLNNEVVGTTPFFYGSNPAHVLADVPQKGKRVLAEEEDKAFVLLRSLDETQQKRVMLADTSPWDIFSFNKRKFMLEKQEGLAMADMKPAQQKLFKDLLQTYVDRYHVTLAKQRMADLEKAGLDKLYFAWMGDKEPIKGPKKGHYYRIHGPTILIEYDNTQNQANHVHTVVRDLTNDWGEDVLAEHYRQQHR